MHRPRSSLLMAALLLNPASPAFAMLIGDVNVTSNMGDPLSARIAISTDDDDSLHEECFRLSGPSSRIAPLDTARVELVRIGGKRYISISTRTPVNDPILDLTLRTEGCGATMQKDFVVLLSPKISATDTDAVTPPVLAPSQAFPAARPDQLSPRTKSPVRKRHPHPRKTHRVAPPSAPSHRQAVSSLSSGFALRLDYGFNSLDQYAEQIARRKQQIQTSAAVKPMPVNPARPQSAPQIHSQPGQANQGDKLVLQSTTDNVSQPAQPASNEGSTASASGSQVPAANGVTATNSPGSPAATTQRGITSKLPGPTQSAKPWYDGIFSSLNLLLLTLFIVLLIALWLKKRSSSSRFQDQSSADLNTLLSIDQDDQQSSPLLSRTLPPVHKTFEEPAEVKIQLNDTFESRPVTAKAPSGFPDNTAFTPQPPPPSDFTVEQFDSTEHVLELAEVMLAFGRSNQAIDTLSQYIRNNPKQSLEPWLKLLDLYFKANQRNEFEALASDLHQRFNVAIADWEEFESAKELGLENSPLTLESLPHIMERLTAFWGSADCLSYLDKLLADNRGGQRHGFSLPLVRDILLLRDILRQSGPTPTPIH